MLSKGLSQPLGLWPPGGEVQAEYILCGGISGGPDKPVPPPGSLLPLLVTPRHLSYPHIPGHSTVRVKSQEQQQCWSPEETGPSKAMAQARSQAVWGLVLQSPGAWGSYFTSVRHVFLT